MTDIDPLARRRRRTTPPTSMSRRLPGLHDGRDVRAEMVDGLWSTEVRMRDVAAVLSPDRPTGLFEYHPEGDWTHVGRFRTLHLGEVALDMLRSGTHLVRSGHRVCTDLGERKVPTSILTYAEAHAYMVEIGLVEGPGEPEGADAPAPGRGAP